MRTTVAIVGAGPAGLTLANLLQRAGIDTVVIEQKSRAHVEQRARAGVLEHRTVELLRAHGLADRLLREGTPHASCEFRYPGGRFSVPYGSLYGGRCHYVYPQQELVKDLIASYLAGPGELHFEAEAIAIRGHETDAPEVVFTDNAGYQRSISARFVAGCDGFHGKSRASVPEGALQFYDMHHGFGWVAILVAAPPSTREIIYALHPRGFAGHMLRSATVSRFYLQCPPDDDIANWPDDRIWSELRARLGTSDGFSLTEGPIIEKNILELRSFVTEPMRFGSLFLAGDAAHIISPAGAKGMNLAIADAEVLTAALLAALSSSMRDSSLLDAYSDTCLRRVWRCQEFSRWMLDLIHTPTTADKSAADFMHKLQIARLEHLRSSASFATDFAENYVGLA